jgi:hypothetical protein
MEKGSCGSAGLRRPSAISSRTECRTSRQYSTGKYSCISPGIEDVDARRDRGVGGEDVVVAGRLQRLFEAQLMLLHQNADPLQARNAEWPSFMW